jgi:hypothetical protein
MMSYLSARGPPFSPSVGRHHEHHVTVVTMAAWLQPFIDLALKLVIEYVL